MNLSEKDSKKKPRKCDLNRNAYYQVIPEDGAQLRAAVDSGDNFKHQALVDYYRSGFANPEAPSYQSGSLVRSINGEGEES